MFFSLTVILWGCRQGAGACCDCPWCELLFMRPEDCLMCGSGMASGRHWKGALCRVADRLTQPRPASAPALHRRPSVPTLTEERGKKKTKQRGSVRPAAPAQNPIHLPLLLQDDFIFQIHKYSPVKAPEINARANACFSLCCWRSETFQSHACAYVSAYVHVSVLLTSVVWSTGSNLWAERHLIDSL